jgi:insecticidal toxin complex protein TccC
MVRYSGKERDNTGLYYYGYRYYAPWLCRWLNADPAREVDGLNLFRMVVNNPVTLEDKMGLMIGNPGANQVRGGGRGRGGLGRGGRGGGGRGGAGQGGDRGRDANTIDAGYLEFEFKANQDIVYGAKDYRNPAVHHLSGLVENKRATSIYMQNHLTDAIWVNRLPTVYTNNAMLNPGAAISGEIRGDSFRAIQAMQKNNNDRARAIEFKEFLLSHPRYNVKDQDQARQLDGLKNVKMNDEVKFPLLLKMWKRTSKAGIEFQLSRSAEGRVHFILDQVVDDIPVVLSKQGHGASVTSTELRWLYRHRNTDAVKNSVVFWKNKQQIHIDNVFTDPAWKDYNPRGGHYQNLAVGRPSNGARVLH